MLKYYLYEPGKADNSVNYSVNVSQFGSSYVFNYPCNDSSKCTDYVIELPPGFYKFELYGASGGTGTGEVSSYHYDNGSCLDDNIINHYKGNTKCLNYFNAGGAGGYVSGTIGIHRSIKVYATIGGEGNYRKSSCARTPRCFQPENMVPGGYGGGGSSSGFTTGSASGGGATSLKFLENTLFHRVLMSGAGGGSDDTINNDGRGGSGGGLVAQGWWDIRNYVGNLVANSTFGFTFGSGEAAQEYISKNPYGVQKPDTRDDKCGSGAGWFGGFASNRDNSGCGGGSSWALTKGSIIPEGPIPYHDEFFNLLGSDTYKFSLDSEFLFSDVIHVP